MGPKVLLVTTNRWYATARLAMAFRKVGVVVDVACPAGHPVRQTAAFGAVYTVRGASPLASIRSAIQAAHAEIVIPADDLARTILHQIHAQCVRRPAAGAALASMLEQSLGEPSCFAAIDSRSALIQLAQAEGIAAPATGVVRSPDEVRAWIARNEGPVVLKTDGTSGGLGVKIATTPAEAETAFQRLNSPPDAARTIKRALVDNDWSLVRPFAARRSPVINVQQFIPGADATIAVACWQGRVLASISVEVLRTWKAKGPASVVRIIHNPEILLAAQKLSARLHLSGLYGFDFVLRETDGAPVLIEMNPRATQTAHLPLGTGQDLPSALVAAAAGEPPPETVSITDNDTIALFPLEWLNDSASPYLTSAYHDVPWEEPRLVSLSVKTKLSNGGWLTYDTLDRLTSRWLRRPR